MELQNHGQRQVILFYRDLSPATVRGYASIVRATRTRAPQIAQKRTFALTDRDVQALINPLQSPKTQRNYVNLIEKATGRKFCVHYRNKRPKEIQVPTALEVLGLVQIFRKTELEVPVMLGAYAGLRRGEICALTISDLDGDYLHINKDMVLDDFGAWITKEPKTPASNRVVLLPHHVSERIRQKGYITHLKPNNITKRFLQRQESLGIDPPYTAMPLTTFIWKCLRKPSQRSKICVNPNPHRNKKRPAKRQIQRSTGYFNAGSGGRTRTK